MNWVQYRNGNYNVYIDLDNGTKIRKNNEDCFIPNTVESMDIKITNKCTLGSNCAYCHEGSGPNGKHGDILSPSFLDNLHPYTELALGGGNILEHPDIDEFLKRCKKRNHICNITVNQNHFIANYGRIKNWVEDKLVYGVGISFTEPSYDLIERAKKIPNSVIHVIAGIVEMSELNFLARNDLKILILGYKQVRRGEQLYNSLHATIDRRISNLAYYLKNMIDEKWFSVISFDNLAIKQLNVRKLFTDEKWDEFYMGDDGQDGQQTSASIFVDMVERKFARNSCAPESDRYELLDTAEEMYAYLVNNKG